jgi:hypothetical protein
MGLGFARDRIIKAGDIEILIRADDSPSPPALDWRNYFADTGFEDDAWKADEQIRLGALWDAALREQARVNFIDAPSPNLQQRLANKLAAIYGPERPNFKTKEIEQRLRDESDVGKFDSQTFYRALRILGWSRRRRPSRKIFN